MEWIPRKVEVSATASGLVLPLSPAATCLEAVCEPVNPVSRPQASYITLVELCVRASQPRLAVQLCAEVSSLCCARQRSRLALLHRVCGLEVVGRPAGACTS